MSATLTWYHAGLGTKTGTGIANFIDDFETLFNSKSGDSNYSWEVASKNSGSSPYYLVLKRKDGSPGRALVISWATLPAGNNPVLLNGNPNTSSVYYSFFPNATTDIPSNLTASSGDIFDDDTDALQVYEQNALSTVYAANFQPFYFDCAEGIFLGTQNPASASCYGAGMGWLVVDANDNAYPCVIRAPGFHNFGSNTASNAPIIWTDSSLTPTTSSSGHINTAYGGANSLYFRAFLPSGPWANHSVNASDVLTDTSNSRAYFVPVPLLGQRKGEGFVLKLRQIALGPGTTGPFTEYSTTGPVTRARQFNAATAGGNGYPWFTNFKL